MVVLGINGGTRKGNMVPFDRNMETWKHGSRKRYVTRKNMLTPKRNGDITKNTVWPALSAKNVKSAMI